jgi:phenylpyruvate tautomerase
MPSLELATNVRIPDKSRLMRDLSDCVCTVLGKAETYMMVIVKDDVSMLFGGNEEPAAHLTMRAAVFRDEAVGTLARELTALMHAKLGIESERVSIVFMDADLSKWAWDGRCFA